MGCLGGDDPLSFNCFNLRASRTLEPALVEVWQVVLSVGECLYEVKPSFIDTGLCSLPLTKASVFHGSFVRRNGL